MLVDVVRIIGSIVNVATWQGFGWTSSWKVVVEVYGVGNESVGNNSDVHATV